MVFYVMLPCLALATFLGLLMHFLVVVVGKLPLAERAGAARQAPL